MTEKWYSFRISRKATLLNLRGYINNYLYDWAVSPSWRLAAKQFGYFSKPSNGYIKDSVIKVKSFSEIKHAANYYGVRKGDLLYFVKKGASSPHHATIIAKVANNTLYYAAHSQPRKEHDAGKSIGTGHLWIVRMK